MKKDAVVKEQINYDVLALDELTEISRHDHQEDVRQYDIQQNALCLVVIGGICFVCALLFLILSVVREKNKVTGIDPTSLPFYVSIGCFAAAAILLSIGLYRFLKAHSKRKALKEEITQFEEQKEKKIKKNEESKDLGDSIKHVGIS